MSKGRRVPTPAQIRRGQVDSYQGFEGAAAWDRAEEQATLRSNTIAVGEVQHPATGLWQIWVSLYGTDLTSPGAWREQATAMNYSIQLQQLFRRWGTTDEFPERINALIAEIHRSSDAEPQPLPDDLVCEILAAVAEAAQERKRNAN